MLDGPDGIRYCWHALREEKKFFQKGILGATQLTQLCETFHTGENTWVRSLEQRWASTRTEPASVTGLLAVFHHLSTEQRPRACRQIHKGLLQSPFNRGSRLAACSSDLTPAENIWGRLVERIFKNSSAYSPFERLKAAILHTCDDVPSECFESM